MNIINYIANNISGITLIAFAVLVIACLVYLLYTKKLDDVIYTLVTEAEKANPSGTGEYKLAEVLSALYKYLPKWMTAVLPKSLLERWVENVLSVAREKWAESGLMEKFKGNASE